MNYVYKYVFDGKIIYIGKCDREIYKRIEEHKNEKKFKPFIGNVQIYYASVANSTMSDAVESELIRRYKPELNVAKMSDWDGIEFVEPKWKLLTEQEVKKEKKEKKKKPLTSKQIENRRKKIEEKEEMLKLAIEFYEKHLKGAEIKTKQEKHYTAYIIELHGIEYDQAEQWSRAILKVGTVEEDTNGKYHAHHVTSGVRYTGKKLLVFIGEYCDKDRFEDEMELAIEQHRREICELYNSLDREMQEGV